MNLKEFAVVASIPIVLGLLLLLAIWVTSLPPIASATVLGKEHRPPTTHNRLMLVGKVMVMRPVHHPERFILTIDFLGTNGKHYTRNRYVGAEEFASISIGDKWEGE